MQTTQRLNTGAMIPRIGLGVFQAERGEETQSAVRDALELGYRHIDTARIYGNEVDVGKALKDSGIPRSEIFVTTKLWNADQGYDRALKAFELSLKRLGLDAIDLYLLHWPVIGQRLDSWRALEAIHASGAAKAIGVSNFMPRHLDELMQHAKVTPAVNQVEISPFLQQRDTRETCAKHGIVVEAYSPLTKGARLDDATVLRVAKDVQRTPAQVLLRWGLQHDLVVLPKSVRRARIAENLALWDFSLSDEAMAALDALEDGYVTGWDPREAK